MPGPIERPVSVFFTADVTLTLATEVVVMTTPGVNTAGVSQTCRIIGSVQVTTGVGATTVTLRCRRASLTGTLVGEANAITTAASTTFAFPFSFDDNPGEVASLPYVITATAAGVAGTAIQGETMVITSS
jgi:hypothetical protein